MPEVSYLTKEGAERLRAELAFLKGPGREQLSARLRAAIQQGDLSENADYIQAKEEQGFLEGRIAELERTLRNVILIEDAQKDTGQVGIGNRVTIQEADYPTEEFHLVGPQEADPIKGMISYESPIGKALVGHRVGEIVPVETPNGVIKLKIIKIEF